MGRLRLIDTIITSLTLRPDDWEYNGFEVTNVDKRTSVWVANGLSWLEIQVEGRKVFGGLSMLPLAPWRWRLFFAAWKIMRRKGNPEDRMLRDLVDKHWRAKI